MSDMKYYIPTSSHGGMVQVAKFDDSYVKVSDHEAEVGRMRAEVEALRDALAPFAEFALVRTAAGTTSPRTGAVYSVHTRLGEAEITAEHFEAAFNAIGASA